MAKELKPIDVSGTPELLRLAQEVRDSGEPRLLRRAGEDLAILTPLRPKANRPRKRARTQADYEAFLASAGSWKDVDTERFKRDNEESRRISSRPPVEL